jgi:hypothetical protein
MREVWRGRPLQATPPATISVVSQYIDVVMMGLLRDEWQARRAK